MKSLTLFIFSSLLFLITTAQAQLVCPERGIELITKFQDNGSIEPSLDADGTRVAFVSFANINGGNPDGNSEIYLFDSTDGIFTQITDTPSGSSQGPSINADGTRVTFQSDANVIGPNPGDNDEIYLFDTKTGIFTQITDVPSGNSTRATVNADGTRIAFQSDAQLIGPNPGFNTEIYLFDTTTGIFTQITNTAMGGNQAASINGDGTRVAFESSANINGGNPEGNLEIYLFTSESGIISQITSSTSGNSRTPSINADGTRIAFHSEADINGGNPDGSEEIYLFDTETGIFTQITDTVDATTFGASINADGTRVAFSSSANIGGGNPGGNIQLYIFDSDSGMTTQITPAFSNASDTASINADGTQVAFESPSNFNGANPVGFNQVWIARCIDTGVGRPIPTLSEWGLVALAAAMGVFGILYAVRRRTATDA